MDELGFPRLPSAEIDPMGWMLWTKYLHPETTVMFERDDGYRDEDRFADLAFADYKDFLKTERQCLAQIEAGGVLDVGAGAGRSSLYFQNRGIDVVALELSRGAAQLASTRGVKKVRQSSVLDLKANGFHWSAIVLIGNGTTVATSLNELRQMLVILRQQSEPDSRLIITSLDILDNPKEHHRTYHAEKKRQGRYPGEFRLRYHAAGQSSGWLEGVLLDPATLASVLHESGWPVRQLIRAANESPLYGMIAG